MQENHKIPLEYDEDVVKLIVSRCTELESGGRMIDAILTNTVLPYISKEFLTRLIEGKPVSRVRLSTADADFQALSINARNRMNEVAAAATIDTDARPIELSIAGRSRSHATSSCG